MNEFAFIDYDKNALLALLENMAMMSFWTLAGYEASRILTGKYLRPLVSIALTAGVYLLLVMYLGIPEAMF